MKQPHPSSDVKPLEDHFDHWLRTVSSALHTRLEGSLLPYDVSVAQWIALRRLYDRDPVTVGEAAELIGTDQSSTSRLIERLVAKQLVLREPQPADRRAVQLRLSPQGRKLVPKLAKIAERNDREFFHVLSTKRRAQLREALERLVKSHHLRQAEPD